MSKTTVRVPGEKSDEVEDFQAENPQQCGEGNQGKEHRPTEVRGNQQGTARKTVDEYPDEKAEQERGQGANRSQHPHVLRCCRQDEYRREGNRDRAHAGASVRYRLGDPEPPVIGLV